MKERVFVDGIEIFRILVDFPCVEGVDNINAFYQRIAENAFRYAKESLLPAARKAYEDDPNPKKRFYFSTHLYSLRGEVTYRTDALLSLSVSAEWQHGTEVDRFLDAHLWNVEKQRLISPREGLRYYFQKDEKLFF